MSGGVAPSHRDLALAGEAASLQSFTRLSAHYEAELSNDLGAVMKTVVGDDNVLGIPIFWAVNADPAALGAEADRTKATIITGYAGAYGNYESLFRDTHVEDIKIVLQMCGGWWVFHQVRMEITDGDGRPAAIECVVIVRAGAEEDGVSGELGWMLDAVTPPAGQDAADRFELIRRYGDHLGAGDLDAVMAMMTDGVQGVVRDYSEAAGGPVLADGAVAMRAAYLVLSEDGRFAARFGWSTPS